MAQIVNGIDVDELKTAMGAVKENSTVGEFRFRAKHRWAGGTHAFTTIQDFEAGGQEDTSRPLPFVLEADEPDVLLGTDFGPNATEAVLHALCSCLSATFIFNASARNVEIEQLELEIEGSLDVRGFMGLAEDVRNGYESINVVFNVKSDASQEQIQELVELAQRRSPVFDIVTHETPVHVRARKVETLPAEPARASM